MEKAIRKTMVLPQSGGENQGGKVRRGRKRITKNPAKYSQ
jgi:hypothetical protein